VFAGMYRNIALVARAPGSVLALAPSLRAALTAAGIVIGDSNETRSVESDERAK
jgi:hypothetical protein